MALPNPRCYFDIKIGDDRGNAAVLMAFTACTVFESVDRLSDNSGFGTSISMPYCMSSAVMYLVVTDTIIASYLLSALMLLHHKPEFIC